MNKQTRDLIREMTEYAAGLENGTIKPAPDEAAELARTLENTINLCTAELIWMESEK